MTKSSPPRVTLSLRALLLLLLINAVVLLGFNLPALRGQSQQLPPSSPQDSPTASPTASLTAVDSSTPEPISTIPPSPVDGNQAGIFVVSLNDNGYAHLFASQSLQFPLIQITNQPWDDITPALNPDGSRLAFSSRKNSYWDLYILDLATGQTQQITDTPEYDGAPTWSPDNQWIAFESYIGDNLDLYILSLVGTSSPIRLTDDPAADQSPSWSPQGRQIAFVSDRSGNNDIWLANLDQVDNRFTNLTQSPSAQESHPVWSGDGNLLAWASSQDGYSSIYVWNSSTPDQPAKMVCPGNWPTWSQDGKLIVTTQPSPNQTYLAAYSSDQGNIALAPVELSGAIYGMDIKPGTLPQPLPAELLQAQHTIKTPLWTPALTSIPSSVDGRYSIVPLEDITAPNPYLHDQVDESFNALRKRTADEVGWDFLSSLENAFVPLTSPLPPAMGNDWLYTGRAFAFNSLPLNAGWMAVVREDSGNQTFWRVYLKTRYQDGSQGVPLHQKAWDLNARYTGDPQTYEQGGQLTARVPAGYWFDFTELASSYGWSRVPAMYNWRTYYPGTLFNRYVMPDGLDWRSAMLEIYPPEIMITPTNILSPTPTVTQTPRWMRPRTDTPTVTPTATATHRPTWTPVGNPVTP